MILESLPVNQNEDDMIEMIFWIVTTGFFLAVGIVVIDMHRFVTVETRVQSVKIKEKDTLIGLADQQGKR